MNAVAVTLYGLPNCDTVKKARAWLAEAGVAVQFHDFKKLGVPHDRLDVWMAAAGWDVLLNRRGTTWRRLDAQAQASASDESGARALFLSQPSVIKRPVVEWGLHGHITVGFDVQTFTTALRTAQTRVGRPT